jgi:hypothetical protein
MARTSLAMTVVEDVPKPRRVILGEHPKDLFGDAREEDPE